MTKLFRVFTHTTGDESVTERLVSAANSEEASANALANVKAQNLGKGTISQSESQDNTTILSVKECGKNGVLAINRIPFSSIASIVSALGVSRFTPTPAAEKDFKTDILKLAGLPEESSMEEAVTILTAIVEGIEETPEPVLQPA